MLYKAIGIGTIKRCLVNERFVHVADRPKKRRARLLIREIDMGEFQPSAVSPLVALPLRPLGPRPSCYLRPPLAAPLATADRLRRAPSLNRLGARPCLPLACNPMPGPYGKARDR